jgi:hypothetical protein
MATQKTYAVPAISSIICKIEEDLVELRGKLAREKRVAALGGATDLRELHELSSQIIDDRDEIVVWRTSLKRFGAQPLTCKDAASVTKCRQSDATNCDDISRDAAAVLEQEYDSLRGAPTNSLW